MGNNPFTAKLQLFFFKIRQPGSRSQTHVQSFATNFRHVQAFQTKIRHVQTFVTKTWRFQTLATMMIRRNFSDRRGGGATETARLIFGMFRLSQPRFAISKLSRPKNLSRLLRPRLIRRDSVAQETA